MVDTEMKMEFLYRKDDQIVLVITATHRLCLVLVGRVVGGGKEGVGDYYDNMNTPYTYT